MLPLANIMGVATEELAIHTGQTVGGLLNATFGNAVELILVIQSLRKGMLTITKGTLLGSILANMLLVLGMAFLFGGLFNSEGGGGIVKNKEQSYTVKTAMVQAQLLLFCSFTIAMPSMFAEVHHVTPEHVVWISRAASFFVLLTYAVFLLFQLYTHAHSFGGAGEELEEEEPQIGVGSALALLVGATCLVAVSSEFLVHAIESFTASTGFSEAFIGVILLPIVGNACEHSTAVVVALKDKMDLAIGIALGSTIQIALFVVPFAVLFGWAIDQPMTLNFEEINAWSLMLSSLLVVSVLVTGHSHWFNGFLLITAYSTLAVLFFFAPDPKIGINHGHH
jgi:Ca2+:H+ antiporter